jgi:hypothetical protein
MKRRDLIVLLEKADSGMEQSMIFTTTPTTAKPSLSPDIETLTSD